MSLKNFTVSETIFFFCEKKGDKNFYWQNSCLNENESGCVILSGGLYSQNDS